MKEFKKGEEVTWSYEDDITVSGYITQITEDEIIAHFPTLGYSDTFYLDGKYTKFESEPSLRPVVELPAGTQTKWM